MYFGLTAAVRADSHGDRTECWFSSICQFEQRITYISWEFEGQFQQFILISL